MMTRVCYPLQDMAALAMGCSQTYRDSVAGLDESVDTSLLMSLSEEVDRAMQQCMSCPSTSGRSKGHWKHLKLYANS
ncbi:choline transporter-like protein 4 [Platysternon megacephalum]|uniref:Choline transporter-like protein 4 n=1 Tax=Platysternon megacephalum TaxID=55544 RepID=A0A4D9DR02_9SAUR|nr:choline transporter-like protein 4 [Platysternon megacephalum]